MPSRLSAAVSAASRTLRDRYGSVHNKSELAAFIRHYVGFFVIYGVFRYLYLLLRRGGGGDPAAVLLQDRHLLGTFGCWLVAVVALLG